MMMKLRVLLLFIAATVHAGTVDVSWRFSDHVGNPQAVKRIVVTPLSQLGIYNVTNIVFNIPISKQTDSTGSLTVSNLANGYNYRVQMYDSAMAQIGIFTNGFTTNDVGAVFGRNFLTITTNAGIVAYSRGQSDARFQPLSSNLNQWATIGTNILLGTGGSTSNAYTQAQSDARFQPLTSNLNEWTTIGTNTLTLLTNGLASTGYVSSAVSTLASTNYVADAISPLASTNYVNGAVSALASTNYVADAISPLASTNYVNSAVSVLASTSYVASAVSTLASTSYVASAISPLASTNYVNIATNNVTTNLLAVISTASNTVWSAQNTLSNYNRTALTWTTNKFAAQDATNSLKLNATNGRAFGFWADYPTFYDSGGGAVSITNAGGEIVNIDFPQNELDFLSSSSVALYSFDKEIYTPSIFAYSGHVIGNFSAASFSGNGYNLTNLQASAIVGGFDATNIVSGTIALARYGFTPATNGAAIVYSQLPYQGLITNANGVNITNISESQITGLVSDLASKQATLTYQPATNGAAIVYSQLPYAPMVTNANGANITNISPANIISNGTFIVNGVLATNSGLTSGAFLSETGASRKYSNNGASITNIVAAFVSGTLTNATTGNAATATLASYVSGTLTNDTTGSSAQPTSVSGTLTNSITGNAATATTLATSPTLTNVLIWGSSARSNNFEFSTAGLTMTNSSVQVVNNSVTNLMTNSSTASTWTVSGIRGTGFLQIRTNSMVEMNSSSLGFGFQVNQVNGNASAFIAGASGVNAGWSINKCDTPGSINAGSPYVYGAGNMAIVFGASSVTPTAVWTFTNGVNANVTNLLRVDAVGQQGCFTIGTNGSVTAVNGFAVTATNTVTLAATGWTNTLGANARVFITVSTTAALSSTNGTAIVTIGAVTTFTEFTMHPLERLVGTGITGKATP